MTTEPMSQTNNWVDSDHSGRADDPWHTHTGEAPPAHAHGATSPLVIFAVGFIGFLLVVTIVIVLRQYFIMGVQKEKIAQQEVSMNADFRGKQALWEASLTGYEWVDAYDGVVRIPLEAAMEKVTKTYSRTP